MPQENDKVRKVAANYIFLPGAPLVKNGYVEVSALRGMRVVDTQGEIREIPGLEFYGGMIVPDYVCEHKHEWLPGMEMLPFLERLYARRGDVFRKIAIIEGADLRRLVWQEKADVRLL
ncbi:MAG: hypothetical protein K2M86_06815 [Odoribacter sp.]|nr:hypothetical protein [Odoribacter sp.]